MSYILLSSAKEDQSSTRSFNEFKNRDELARHILEYYDDYRCTLGQPEAQHNDEYTTDDLFQFVDGYFGELVCLERQESSPNLWIPHDTDWTKEGMFLYLMAICKAQIGNITSDKMDVDKECEEIITI